MKITRISVYLIDLPLEHPYWLSGGRLKFELLDATFVKIETDSGITGWGGGTPWGHTYVPAHGPGIRAGIETMAAVILGQDPSQLNQVERAMDMCLPGHLYAKAPVDLACWDIAGQAAELSIADLLGGRGEEGTWIASPVSSGEPDTMLGIIESYRQKGYKSHSVKVGGGIEKDITCMRDVALAHGIQVYVMATGGSVLADTEAALLAQTIPFEYRLGTWACQDMLTVDIAPDQGARSHDGKLTVTGIAGHGVVPDESILGDPVAVYT